MPARFQLGSRYLWLIALAALTLVQLASSKLFKGQALIAFADIFEFAITLLIVTSTAVNIPRSRDAARGFWILMTVSAAMWSACYANWVYHEVIRGTPMPAVHIGDVILVLHVVPTMMALALMPQYARRSAESLSSSIEFVLIACWWVYMYFQFAFVWQYLSYDAATFHRNFNLLYHAELAVVIIALLYLAHHSQQGWRELFHHYMFAFLLYAPTSSLINILIQQGKYVSGGPWDLPLTLLLAYFAWIGFHAHRLQLEPATVNEEQRPRLLPEWAGTVAAASIPLIALFSYERFNDPPVVRKFRVALGFSAMLVLTLLILTRQQLLSRRLAGLLEDAQRSYENLQRLQTQFVQSEKLASIGRLVSGAAHEINNPLTIILGYSELLATDENIPATQRGLAEKIIHQARRTKHLVSNLLAFARQNIPQKRLTDLNSVVNNACQLRLGDLPSRISLVRDLQPELPQVLGDDNQLLQVSLHLLNNAVDSVEQAGGGEIIVRTGSRDDNVILEICDSGIGIQEPSRVFDPFYTTKPLGHGAGLGLSACYGIIQDHHGTIECFNLAPRGAIFRITLKAVPRAAAAPKTVVLS